MSVKFKVIGRTRPGFPLSPVKYFAQPVKDREIGFRELTAEISMRCSMNRATVMAVVESLIDVIPEKLLKGHTVRVGDFGIFSLSLHSEGQATECEVTPKTVTSCKLNFLAGRTIKLVLKNATYQRVSEAVAERMRQSR